MTDAPRDREQLRARLLEHADWVQEVVALQGTADLLREAVAALSADRPVALVGAREEEKRLLDLWSRIDMTVRLKFMADYPDGFDPIIRRLREAVSASLPVETPDLRSCTCHPDDNPPVPCAKRYAYSECKSAAEASAPAPDYRELVSLRQKLAHLEDVVLPHARKQENANGFQRGWHAALSRVSEGDNWKDLADLVPQPAHNPDETKVAPPSRGAETAPMCLHCGKQMHWEDEVSLEGDGVVVTMSNALVCECGYKTIKGSQMGEFQNRVLAAKLAKAEARLASRGAETAAVLAAELRTIAAFIRTPGNVFLDDAINECALMLENRAVVLSRPGDAPEKAEGQGR